MDYESMWNKLKSTLVLTQAGLERQGKQTEAGILEFVLDEMTSKEEFEELMSIK